MSGNLARLYEVPAPLPQEIVFDVDEGYPLIPDAIYSAACTSCEAKQTFGTLKLYFKFRITEGEQSGKILFAAFNVGRGKRPKLIRGGDLFKMLCRVLSLPANTKAHRVSSRELVGKVCNIQSRTVTKDYRQRSLPAAACYSVVGQVIEVLAG